MPEVLAHTNPDAFSRAVEGIGEYRLEVPVVANLGSGVEGFAAAAFRGSTADQLYASVTPVVNGERITLDDELGELVNPKTPWLAVYTPIGGLAVDTWKTHFELGNDMGMVLPRIGRQPVMACEVTVERASLIEIVRIVKPHASGAAELDNSTRFFPLPMVLTHPSRDLSFLG